MHVLLRLLPILAIVCSGCYDGNQLVALARAEAMRSRSEEVALGHFQTTMPRDPETDAQTEMEFSIYGTVAHYRIPDIEAKIRSDGYRLRYAILTAVRQADAEELAEPEFSGLRRRIIAEVNQFFEDAPIQSIGFSNVRFLHH